MGASATRKEWFECACCPPNFTRWLVQTPGFVYAAGKNDLYRYLDASTPPVKLGVNGQSVPLKMEKGFAILPRAWRSGDVIELDMPMPIRRVIAHPAVKDLIDQVAVERGPIVYCAEGIDHDGRVLDLPLADDARLEAVWVEDFGGVKVIIGEAWRGAQLVPLRLIPHFAWSNRGVNEMTVWMNRRTP